MHSKRVILFYLLNDPLVNTRWITVFKYIKYNKKEKNLIKNVGKRSTLHKKLVVFFYILIYP